MVLQWPVEGADEPTMSMNCWKSMSPAAWRSRAFQTIGARAGQLLLEVAVQHRPDVQRDRRDVHGRGRHQAGRHGLVAAREQDDAVQGIAVQHLDQRQVGEVAVERRRGALAGFLDRVARELEGDAARRRDAFAHALGEFHVVAVAGRQVRSGLGDADQRLARAQLLRRQPVVQVPLQVERGHPRIVRIVEPRLRAQVGGRDAAFVAHGRFLISSGRRGWAPPGDLP